MAEAKCAQARSPGRTRFNLEVDEVAVLRGMMEYWRRDLHLPLRLLVVWRPRDGSAPELLERWEIHFSMGPALTGREDEAVLLGQVRALWKRIMVLLRTLYSHSLSLPAAQLQRRAELAARTGNGACSLWHSWNISVFSCRFLVFLEYFGIFRALSPRRQR
ncbi:hypothetical protein M885DRAFT_498771 [Pelagophyceae sp. CCMP2097]|nr:hypothetical protein M885DRAFT_498771 [Pelagophyceae sp. CCMP2097]